jgi:ribosomal protein S8
MWQVVYIASSKQEAQEILNIMEKEGFLVDIENTGSDNYQIKVPAIEAEEAYSCLHKNF